MKAENTADSGRSDQGKRKPGRSCRKKELSVAEQDKLRHCLEQQVQAQFQRVFLHHGQYQRAEFEECLKKSRRVLEFETFFDALEKVLRRLHEKLRQELPEDLLLVVLVGEGERRKLKMIRPYLSSLAKIYACLQKLRKDQPEFGQMLEQFSQALHLQGSPLKHELPIRWFAAILYRDYSLLTFVRELLAILRQLHPNKEILNYIAQAEQINLELTNNKAELEFEEKQNCEQSTWCTEQDSEQEARQPQRKKKSRSKKGASVYFQVDQLEEDYSDVCFRLEQLWLQQLELGLPKLRAAILQ